MSETEERRPVVANLQYGGAYRHSLEEAERTGRCVFCQPEFRRQALFHSRDRTWFVINVLEEYRQADREGKKPPYQLLFVPLAHGDDTKFLTAGAVLAIDELLEKCKRTFRIRGGCPFNRDGDPLWCGRTVRHPHVHYYVPRVVKDATAPGGFRTIPIDIPAG